MRRGLSLTVVTVGTLALWLIVPPGELRAAHIYGCRWGPSFETIDRRVPGAVNAECSGDQINCFPFLGHSVPWGNWGVDSNGGSRQNTFQFAGWRSIDNQLQWNSCTGEFPPPDADKYNDDNSTKQITTSGVEWYGGLPGGAAPDTPCSDVGLDGLVVTSTGNWMEMWELDGCDEDEFVARAEYPDTTLVVSCQGEGAWSTCYGETGWERSDERESECAVSPNEDGL